MHRPVYSPSVASPLTADEEGRVRGKEGGRVRGREGGREVDREDADEVRLERE